MNMTKLSSFSGMALVMGKERETTFADGKLTIGSLTAGEVATLLGAVGGAVSTADAGPVNKEQPVKAETTKPALASVSGGKAAPTTTTPAKTTNGTNGVHTAPRVSQANPAKPTTKPAAKVAPVEEEPEELEEEEEEETGEEPEQAADGDIEVPGDVLSAMKKATKIKEVLQPMIDLGINSYDALVAKCEALKSEVPVLSRIPDLADRVKRAAEILGIEA